MDSPNFWKCDCANELACKRATRSGVQYGYQCTRCGKWRCVRKSAMPLTATLSDYDGQIGKAFAEDAQRKSREHYESQRRSEQESWFEQYNEYLKSSEWRSRRQRVLDRDGHLCQACLRRKATQVHHLTYEHVGNEPLFELTSVCRVCHEAIHSETVKSG